MVSRKLYIAFCAVAMLATVACNKEPLQSPASDGATPTEQPRREGEFNPECKISIITFSDNTAPELWFWNDSTGLLMSVEVADLCGGYTDKTLFAYNADGRVNTVTMTGTDPDSVPLLGELSGMVTVEYGGNKVATLSLTDDGEVRLRADVEHDGPKVSGATLSFSNNMLADLFNHVMSEFNYGNLGISADSVSGNVAFVWSGDNVSRMLFSVAFRAGTTLGAVRQVMGYDSIAGFANLPDSEPIRITVVISDTVDYTYDNMPNPYCGFLGRVHISALTAGNVTSEEHNATATVTFGTAATPQILRYTRPMPLPTRTCRYDYNDKGFPVSLTDDKGVVSFYEYMK